MTDYYEESLAELKKKYGDRKPEKTKRVFFVLSVVACVILIAVLFVVFCSILYDEPEAARGRYAESLEETAEYVGSVRKETGGVSYEFPEGWVLIDKWYYAETGEAVSMISIAECEPDEISYLISQNSLSKESAEIMVSELIKGFQEDESVKDLKVEETKAVKRANLRFYMSEVSFDYHKKGRGVLPADGEIDLLYNDQNGKVIVFVFLQTQNVETDHAEDFYELLESVRVE